MWPDLGIRVHTAPGVQTEPENGVQRTGLVRVPWSHLALSPADVRGLSCFLVPALGVPCLAITILLYEATCRGTCDTLPTISEAASSKPGLYFFTPLMSFVVRCPPESVEESFTHSGLC
eukprot:scaffold4437_cov391-Prasinococcus_capsulatus_cf.AAC.13